MRLDLPIVFVHLGRSRPRWLIPNLRMHRDLMPNSIILVTDNDYVARSAKRLGVQVFRYVEALSDPLVPETDRSVLYFRKGFWRETSRRFSALAAFHAVYAGPLIHVESDVILFPSFPSDQFLRVGSGLAFPLADSLHGIGSIVFLRDADASLELAKHMSASAPNGGGEDQRTDVNDMTRLASFRESTDDVLVLPTAIRDGQLEDESSFYSLVSGNFSQFMGIFDASSLGQFLAGTDSRNHRGWRQLGGWSFAGIDPASWNFSFSDGCLWVEDPKSKNQLPVFNLHIHSKDLRMFDLRSRERLLRERCLRPPRPGEREFDLWGLTHASVSFARRIPAEGYSLMRELTKMV